jgi:PAB-dependent poly(A)-specific ribonuclease subunit 2
MYGVAKIPCIAAYSRVDAPPPPPLPPSPITEDVYRRLTLDANLPRRCPFTPFDFESPAETPRPG